MYIRLYEHSTNGPAYFSVYGACTNAMAFSLFPVLRVMCIYYTPYI